MRPSSARSRSRKSWWRRYQPSSWPTRCRKRFWPSIWSRRRAESVLLEDRIAQRRPESVEHGRSGEERDLLTGQVVEHLGAEVLGEERMAAVRRRGRLVARPLLHGEGGEVQTGRPALRAGGQLLDVGRQQLDPAVAKQVSGFLGIERQVVDPELVQPTVGAQPGRGPAGRGAGGHQQAVLHGELGPDLGDDVEGLGVRDRLDVVDGEGERLALVVDPREQPSHHRLDGPVGLDRVDHDARQCVDAVEGGGDGGEQHRGIVVAFVGGHPRGTGRGSRGPLREQRGLAVARGRRDRDDRRFGGRDPIEERGPLDDARSLRRRVELGGEEVEPERADCRDGSAGARRTSTEISAGGATATLGGGATTG